MPPHPPHLQLDLFGDAIPGPAPIGHDLAALAAGLGPNVSLGTSSWSFPGWSGIVYDPAANIDESALARHGLAAYAAHPLLRTVGVDRTYYAPLSASDFAHYAAQVPGDFRFVVKAWQDLVRPSTVEETAWHRGLARNPHFLAGAVAEAAVIHPAREGLGEKLGVVLFQFPPLRRAESGSPAVFAERLAAFLAALPRGPAYAVELRSRELLSRALAHVLEIAGASPCFVVHPAMPPLARQVEICDPARYPFLLVRWTLHSGQSYESARLRYQPFDRLVDEDPAVRLTVAGLVREAAGAGRPAFVIANNKAEGSAPLTLVALARAIASHGG
jgi:uncharacterized protein YecE (DUF72 family)